MIGRSLMALVPIFGLLGGCGSMANHVDFSESRTDFPYLPGSILVQVLGNPFQESDEEVANAVTDAMDNSTPGRRVDFYPGTPDNHSFVRFAFGGSDVTSICDADAQKISAAGNGGDIIAAYCSSGDTMSVVKASMSGIGSVHDPEFTRLAREITRMLLPSYKFEEREFFR